MKKRDLFTFALIGISATLAMGACRDNGEQPKAGAPMMQTEQMSPDMQTYYNGLSVESKKKFDKMDMRHRQAAMEMGGDVNKSVDTQYNEQMKMMKGESKPAPVPAQK